MAKKRPSPLSPEAVHALRAAVFAPGSFTLTSPNLPCYDEVKAVVAHLGGAWEASTGRHVFPAGLDVQSMVLALCDRGILPASNPLDYFPTPAAVLDELLGSSSIAGLIDGLRFSAQFNARPVRFLEPNAGSGALFSRLHALFPEFAAAVAVEINPLMVDSLGGRFPSSTVIEGDFLTVDLAALAPFDLVLMNPPFAGRTYQKHVRRAFELLAPFGVLLAIVPAYFANDPDFGFFVAENGFAYDLGPDRFAGTSTPTACIAITRDPANQWRDQPRDGFSTSHAWNLQVCAASDSTLLRQLQRAADFKAALGVLTSWAHDQVRQGSAVRVDERIAGEALRSLVYDYDLELSERILPPELNQTFRLAS